ncbi:MAG: hypothetical protein HY319_12510 [Armatimonadetes bacterium]|nr:hypothetical protein [Armatimonadota bacterium]
MESEARQLFRNRSLAGSNPTVATSWNAVKLTLADLQSYMDTYPASALVAGGPRHSDVDAMRRTLGQLGGADWMGRGNDHFYNLWNELENNIPGPSPTKDFLARKFYELDELYDGKSRADDNVTEVAYDPVGRLADWSSGAHALRGWFDTVIDEGNLPLFSELVSVTRSIDYSKVGTSYFQGVVYSNGSIYCANEVTVIGALMARDDGSQGPFSPELDPSLVLNPGDVYLGNNSNLTYVEDFFDDAGGGGGGGSLSVSLWLGR